MRGRGVRVVFLGFLIYLSKLGSIALQHYAFAGFPISVDNASRILGRLLPCLFRVVRLRPALVFFACRHDDTSNTATYRAEA
ncbi:Hypothetical protein CAP_5624 [Chondromyces apiculatus DSM 436]|uniref:Uncharacterized protein n=1 Tax=Chondromyces apiculatus DSM 436 TaxID=1192034 RepID=A0A017T224_9BACT|nr:Hypothetical protein CAP_5624 [Chondromyces apiculatus DSM 436]